MKEFKKDLMKWKEYDYVVINDDLKLCYKKIMYFIKSKKYISFDKVYINNHVKKLINQSFIGLANFKIFIFR